MARQSKLIPLSPVLLVATANALRAMPPARRWGKDGIGLVHFAGYYAHFDFKMHRSSWIIPLGQNCAELARFAESERIFADRPAAGDIFLAWSEHDQRFTRAGIVEVVAGAGAFSTGLWYFDCRTIEAFPRPRRRYDEVRKEKRKLSPECGDRFVRWADLDGRYAVSDPVSKEQVDLATMRVASVA